MNKLYLVRHAKSSWKDRSLSDLQRPLNKRGLKNAPEMGRRLNAADVRLDLIISSPAKRALTTAITLAQEIAYDTEKIIINNDLYFESISSMLEILNNTNPDIKSLMIVGHNPDMTTLLNKLCGFQSLNMPTCAIASIHFEQSWTEIDKYSVSLFEYDYPKKST